MARILHSGFEAYPGPWEEGWRSFAGATGVNEVNARWTSGGAHLFEGSGPSRREIGGDRYFQLDDNAANVTAAERVLSTNPTEAWGAFHYNMLADNRRDNARIFELRLSGVGKIVELREEDRGNGFIGVRAHSTADGSLQLNDNNIMSDSDGEWHHIEWHVLLAGSNGRMEVWVDGEKRIDYTGPLAGPGGETSFDTIVIGMGNSSGTSNFENRGYDNVIINDTTGNTNNGRVGEEVILPVRPSRPGATTQLQTDLGGPDPDTNFKRVRRESDTNGFAGALNAGEKDTYGMSGRNVSSDAGRVDTAPWPPVREGYFPALNLQARAVQNGPSISNIRYALIPTGQAEFQTPAAPGLPMSSLGLDTVEHIVDENANTGDPFSYDDAEGMEAGYSMEA